MIRAWVTEGEGVREVAPSEAVARAIAGTGNAWLDFEASDEAEVAETLAAYKIHPLALEDMVGEANRPKVDNYGAYIYLVVHSARWDGERPLLRELDILVGERFIATYHDAETRPILAARDVLPRRPELLVRGPASLLHYLLDVMVDNYLPIMDQVSDEVDELEERLIEDAHGVEVARVMRLKRGMSAMRRIVGPQRDTVLALTRDEFKPIPAEARPYLRDVYDRLARVSDLLDSYRDEVSSLLELQASLASNRLNEVIKRLTVLATIGLPLTVVVSYYGMNVQSPVYAWPWPYGELLVLGLLVASALGTWAYLRWRRWD